MIVGITPPYTSIPVPVDKEPYRNIRRIIRPRREIVDRRWKANGIVSTKRINININYI